MRVETCTSAGSSRTVSESRLVLILGHERPAAHDRDADALFGREIIPVVELDILCLNDFRHSLQRVQIVGKGRLDGLRIRDAELQRMRPRNTIAMHQSGKMRRAYYPKTACVAYIMSINLGCIDA